jgi:arabinogalactan oligomer/maltooligosaccharide transport system permease protein
MTQPAKISQAAALAAMGERNPVKRRRAFLLLCLVPALVVLALVLVYPLFYNVALSLSDAGVDRMRHWRLVGLQQYAAAFREPEFWIIFSKTIIWTVVGTGLQVALGTALALILHQQFIAGQSAWRLLLLLPWAVPQYIAALTWRGMFDGAHGAVNSFLGTVFGLPPIDWLNSAFETFTAAVLVNVWMGFPFMMIVALSGLQAIPANVYEAARLEGAGAWCQFSKLTAPLLRPVMVPAATLGIIWNFNNLNAIWLFSNGGAPDDSTHILVSYVYKAAFTYYQYGWAAALSVVIFVILFLFVQGFMQLSQPSK